MKKKQKIVMKPVKIVLPVLVREDVKVTDLAKACWVFGFEFYPTAKPTKKKVKKKNDRRR